MNDFAKIDIARFHKSIDKRVVIAPNINLLYGMYALAKCVNESITEKDPPYVLEIENPLGGIWQIWVRQTEVSYIVEGYQKQ